MAKHPGDKYQERVLKAGDDARELFKSLGANRIQQTRAEGTGIVEELVKQMDDVFGDRDDDR